jgi:hypothetical protein
MHHAQLTGALYFAYPSSRREIDGRVSDDLPAALDANIAGELLLDLVPGLSINSIIEAADRSHARVVRLDGRSFRWGRGRRRLDTLVEDAARLFGERGRTLPFVQTDGSLGGGSRPRGVTGGAQNRCQ